MQKHLLSTRSSRFLYVLQVQRFWLLLTTSFPRFQATMLSKFAFPSRYSRLVVIALCLVSACFQHSPNNVLESTWDLAREATRRSACRGSTVPASQEASTLGGVSSEGTPKLRRTQKTSELRQKMKRSSNQCKK